MSKEHCDKLFKRLFIDPIIPPKKNKTYTKDQFNTEFEAPYRLGKRAFVSKKRNGETIFCDTKLEVTACTILDNHDSIATFQVQPLQIKYTRVNEHRSHRYTPDIALLTNNGELIIIEVKSLCCALLNGACGRMYGKNNKCATYHEKGLTLLKKNIRSYE